MKSVHKRIASIGHCWGRTMNNGSLKDVVIDRPSFEYDWLDFFKLRKKLTRSLVRKLTCNGSLNECGGFKFYAIVFIQPTKSLMSQYC